MSSGSTVHCSPPPTPLAAASWERYESLWHCSSPCTLRNGFEDTNHRVYQELQIGTKEESTLNILPTFLELGQEDLRVSDVKGYSLIRQEVQDFTLNQVLSPACLTLAVRVICSSLLVQSLPVAVDAMDKGEKEISLFHFQ